MEYQYIDCLQHIPSLNQHVRRRIRTDHWKDIVQDTLLYLHLKFDDIEITNIKGLMINTANFFIQKHYTRMKNNRVVGCNNIEEVVANRRINMKANIRIGKYNSCLIDDNLFKNLNSVSRSLFIPFQMQLNGYSIEEIGDKLDVNENTVKTRIRRCKHALKDNLTL